MGRDRARVPGSGARRRLSRPALPRILVAVPVPPGSVHRGPAVTGLGQRCRAPSRPVVAEVPRSALARVTRPVVCAAGKLQLLVPAPYCPGFT